MPSRNQTKGESYLEDSLIRGQRRGERISRETRVFTFPLLPPPLHIGGNEKGRHPRSRRQRKVKGSRRTSGFVGRGPCGHPQGASGTEAVPGLWASIFPESWRLGRAQEASWLSCIQCTLQKSVPPPRLHKEQE